MAQRGWILLAVALTISGWRAAGQQAASQGTAKAIMVRVAANQDRAEGERAHYVYVQHARSASRKGKTVYCEELTDFRVTPTATGSEQHLLKLNGRLLRKGKYVAYDTLLPEANGGDDDSISFKSGDDDRDMLENMRSHFINDKSKDGVASRLFPLTSKNQAEYSFQLLRREQMNGREVYHVAFQPKDKSDFGWRGDAYIDTQAYQPVVVRTAMSRKIPFAVRTLLGTSLPGLGFTVVYAPMADGVWFPASFGTEFKVHVLFFFNREIVIDAQNREFEKTHVSSEFVGGDGVVTP